MRPDRIVVGEVRDAEALDLLLALNAGLPGMCTLHANSARDALAKLCTLPLLAGRNIDAGFILPTVAASLDLVVHCELLPDGRRRIREVVEPTGVEGSTITARTLFEVTDAVASPAPVPTASASFPTSQPAADRADAPSAAPAQPAASHRMVTW